MSDKNELKQIYDRYLRYMRARRDTGAKDDPLTYDAFATRWAELDENSCKAALDRFSTDYRELLEAGRQQVAEVLEKLSTSAKR